MVPSAKVGRTAPVGLPSGSASLVRCSGLEDCAQQVRHGPLRHPRDGLTPELSCGNPNADGTNLGRAPQWGHGARPTGSQAAARACRRGRAGGDRRRPDFRLLTGSQSPGTPPATPWTGRLRCPRGTCPTRTHRCRLCGSCFGRWAWEIPACLSTESRGKPP
jgi:hypothetical protein